MRRRIGSSPFKLSAVPILVVVCAFFGSCSTSYVIVDSEEVEFREIPIADFNQQWGNEDGIFILTNRGGEYYVKSIRVGLDSVWFTVSESEIALSRARGEIISISTKSHSAGFFDGFAYGFLVGAALGLEMVYFHDESGMAAPGYGLLGGLLGSIVGALIGHKLEYRFLPETE